MKGYHGHKNQDGAMMHNHDQDDRWHYHPSELEIVFCDGSTSYVNEITMEKFTVHESSNASLAWNYKIDRKEN